MLHCDTCTHYTNPQKILIYPNTPEPAGWVRCAKGGTVKRVTMACGHHPTHIKEAADRAEGKQKRQLVHDPAKRQLVHTPAPDKPKGRRLIA